MSTLTVADNKGGKKPQYKDYVSFLGNYKAGKKDDQCSVITNDSGVSFSLNNSSNNSSSSINSDLTDPPKNGFKEYLEQYNHKKYSSVQPSFSKKQNNKPPEEGKTMKTEVYIEINNPSNALSQVSKVFEINNTQGVHNQVNNVGKVSKIFEKNSATSEHTVVAKAVHSNGKVNTFMFEQKDTENQSIVRPQQRKTSIGEISKKFETHSSKSTAAAETHKVPLKKTPSISEKSKLFEEINTGVTSQVDVKRNAYNEVSRVFQQKEDNTTPKTNGSISPKPPVNTKPVLGTKTSAESTSKLPNSIYVQQKTTKSLQITIPSPPPPPPVQNSENSNGSLEQSSVPFQNTTCSILPPPPPPLQPLSQCSIPPPPPPPPANMPPKKLQQFPQKSVNTDQKTLLNGPCIPPTQNGKKSDVVDGIPVPVVDKNDPRVKKLVYGALREMYGAYHDKANDYIATLPRNRVRKNNGLDSIINSIASQGGLEKLNGRANPTVENE